MVYKLQSSYLMVQCIKPVTLAQDTRILIETAMTLAICKLMVAVLNVLIFFFFIILNVLFQDTSNPSVDHLSSGLERYKDLQKYFNRRLKATYRRFSNIPDYSVVRPAFCFGFTLIQQLRHL